ncbi:hypothetical protein ABZ769_13445 [Streptomyces olivoreticuli]
MSTSPRTRAGAALIVTNDFPPRQGGIETFVHALATRLPGLGTDVVVYTGRRWVEQEWTWDTSARHLARLLTPTLSRTGH